MHASELSRKVNLPGIEAPSFLASPTDIWSSLYSNYSSEALAGGQLRMGMYRYQAGRDFGVNMSVFPNGTDPGLNLELLYRLVEQQRAQQQNSPKACVSTLGPNGWVTTCD